MVVVVVDGVIKSEPAADADVPREREGSVETVVVTVTSIEVEGTDERLADAETRDESDEMAVANEETDAAALVDADNDKRPVRVMRGLEVGCTDTLPWIDGVKTVLALDSNESVANALREPYSVNVAVITILCDITAVAVNVFGGLCVATIEVVNVLVAPIESLCTVVSVTRGVAVIVTVSPTLDDETTLAVVTAVSRAVTDCVAILEDDAVSKSEGFVVALAATEKVRILESEGIDEGLYVAPALILCVAIPV